MLQYLLCRDIDRYDVDYARSTASWTTLSSSISEKKNSLYSFMFEVCVSGWRVLAMRFFSTCMLFPSESTYYEGWINIVYHKYGCDICPLFTNGCREKNCHLNLLSEKFKLLHRNVQHMKNCLKLLIWKKTKVKGVVRNFNQSTKGSIGVNTL